ncbi:uncharacterized protein LOC121760620 [Salvia splendens]|uniref:uncharacterized protein LOC121760620 n=1 Tax=Salvia splendens TaxID=180675 RepID=UPI001C25A9D6|nr:uncharacterized protein LOC121760620 [Salvia splendens]
MEEDIALAQEEYEGRPSPGNRTTINKLIATYILLLKMEDFWRQKATLRWLAEGNKGTRFYQSLVKQKRIQMRIHTIKVNWGEVTDKPEIRESAVDFYKNLLAPEPMELGDGCDSSDPTVLSGGLSTSKHYCDEHRPLAKKASPETWGDYRPISLCTVISPNQSGFVKGRFLHDNVLLAQEMFHELARCSPAPNVAVKIDMAKAYDSFQWSFFLKVLRRIGFPDAWTGLIERCIGSCWFSVLINGVPAVFFKSTRGLRQGDPISPALFLIAADYLSRALDRLILGKKDMIFKASRRCMEISHLAYADDIIIFTQAAANPLHRLRACLDGYEGVSRQQISLPKSNIYIAEAHEQRAHAIQSEGGFSYSGESSTRKCLCSSERRYLEESPDGPSERLGIRKFTEVLRAFYIKLWWRFREQSSLWARYMMRKYCASSLPLSSRTSGRHRPTWKRLAKTWVQSLPHIRWLVGQGHIYFWDDLWLGDPPLRGLCFDEQGSPAMTVSEFINDSAWDVPKLQLLHDQAGLSQQLIEQICQTSIISGEPDVPRWTLSRSFGK